MTEKGRLRHYAHLARPHQYIKNGFILLPLFFGYKLGDVEAVLRTLAAVLAFCLAASAVYAYNDVRDAALDRLHPVKKNRPVASGAIRPEHAMLWGIVLALGALVIAAMHQSPVFMGLIIAYLLLQVLYSLLLKHVAVLDVACVASGFVLRVFAGADSAGVEASHWLVLMTFLLAAFLALAKRRDDLLILAESGSKSRPSLDGYNLEFVSAGMVTMAAVTIVSYIQYTLSAEVVQKHHSDHLYLTTFWVILGLLRYMQITFVQGRSGSPSTALFKDLFLQAVLLGWIGSFFLLIYVARS